MKTLKSQIIDAKNETELQSVVDAMPKNSNGVTSHEARMLDSAFWYYDLTTLDSKRNFMLKLIEQNFGKQF
jgi:hypothetical protein